MGTPVSALASTLSSAGSAAAGAGGLIGAVSSLLPTTQTGKFHNTATASSDSLNTQAEIGSTTSKGTEKNKGIKTTSGTTDNIGTERSSASQTQSGKQTGLQAFSGAENTTTTQTMLTDPAAMRIVNLMLQGDAGIPGLQQVVSGERNAGVFNSSTNQMLLNNLAATISGEVARLSAPTVSKENLGSSSTTTDQSNQSTADSISTVLNNLAQISKGAENTDSTNTIESTVLNALMGLATQSTDQSQESQGTSKTKTSKCPVSLVFCGLLGLADNCAELETLRTFRDTQLTAVETSAYYEFGARYYGTLETVPVVDYPGKLQEFKLIYLDPFFVALEEGNLEKAKQLYEQAIKSV